jgi:hypothetical protein
MAEAAYATGTALLGAPRLLSGFYFIPNVFVLCFSARPKQCGALKSPSPPKNARPQNLKSEAPSIKLGPNVFFVPCFSVSTRGPKELYLVKTTIILVVLTILI